MVPLSASSSRGTIRSILDSELERRGGKSFGPIGGGRLTLFLDDLNLPAPDAWGDRPALEVLRTLQEHWMLPFLERDRRGEFKSIEDVTLIATATVADTSTAASFATDGALASVSPG